MKCLEGNCVIPFNKMRQRSQMCFVLYIFSFFCLSVKLFPNDLVVILMIILFVISPFEILPFMYFFSLPWTYVATLSFGITLSLAQSVLYLLKIIIKQKAIHLTMLEIFLAFDFLFCGILSALINRSLTLISFIFYFLIVCSIRNDYFQRNESRDDLIQGALFSVLVSVGIATIYGFVHSTGIQRWVHGVGYSMQLYGTMGTTRFGMYLCIALLYPLYYVKKKVWKIVLCSALSVGVLTTVSITACALLSGIYFFYFLTVTQKKHLVVLVVVVIGLIIICFSNSDYFFNISILKPILSRFEFAIQEAKLGNYAAATSGRSNLMQLYFEEMHNRSLIDILLGVQKTLGSFAKFSHNSYIDMINNLGIVGGIGILSLQTSRIISYFRYPERNQLLLLKIIILLTAGTVSIFTAQYWQVMLYL